MMHTGGRPPVGPKVTIRMEPELKAVVEAYAATHQFGLAEAVRELLAEGLRVADEAEKHRAAWERHTAAQQRQR